MNANLLVTVFLCAAVAFSNGVKVTVEDFSFSLEAVKQLSPFLDGVPQNPRFLGVDADVLCSNPNLPEDFVKICGTPQSPKVFHALATISRSPHICEICANVACSGC